MREAILSSFAVRLRDVLATLESASVLTTAESRMRGLGEQLQFACMALPCDEALVAVELQHLGRLSVPGIATADSWRTTEIEMSPSGTPLAYLLGGGSGFAAELEAGDAILTALQGELQSSPHYAVFVPVRAGASVIGGAVLLRESEPLGDAELGMCERLGEVLSLTLETYRSERVLLRLFAEVLPDLCASDAPTRFAQGLEEYLHRLRLGPEYRQRLDLAAAVGRVAAHGPSEARMCADILARIERYLRELEKGDGQATPGDDLYG